MSEIDEFSDYMIEDYNDKLMGYDEIRKEINENYNCSLTNKEVRKEFLDAINKVFSSMLEDYSDRVFDVIYVMMEEFKVNESKLIRYLNDENMTVLRNFAKNNYETRYWEVKEKEKKDAKFEKMGKKFEIRDSIFDLFE